jgi:site-specific recombinase XerD
LTAADVSGFLARECPRHGAASAQLLVTVVRSLLGYLHVEGFIAAPLDWAVPAVAALKGRSLPQALEPATLSALLGTCDRRRTVGRRDYAILLLLSRLGLRASEVAGLRLDDVGWRAGELVVRGKGGRVDSLPLPVDVGEALASYLRRRPSVADDCRSPTAAHRRDRDAPLGRHAGGDRASAAASRATHDRDLRARGPRHAQSGRDAVAGGAVMTALEQALSDYLRLRRGLGYYLERDQGELEGFLEFLQQARAERITTELAVQWARMPATQHPVIWRKRLSTVRGFARYLATVDPASEIPSKDLLRAHQPRTAPYIYSGEEITELIAAARSLPGPLVISSWVTTSSSALSMRRDRRTSSLSRLASQNARPEPPLEWKNA